MSGVEVLDQDRTLRAIGLFSVNYDYPDLLVYWCVACIFHICLEQHGVIGRTYGRGRTANFSWIR
jgi:hypothetical protein